MSSPPPEDFFPLGPEHENPDQPGEFFPLGPEHETPSADIPVQPSFSTNPQWEAKFIITLPSGERQEQFIRVPREETDTDQIALDKIFAAAAEIQAIIAERGGLYDTQVDLSTFEEV
jgi:hypothetical protein